MRIIGPLLLLVTATVPMRAMAGGEDREQAMRRFNEGRKLYQVGEYKAALELFKQAFLVKEDAVFLFNIAQCYRQLGSAKDAITYYRRFLVAEPRAENRKLVEKIIRELEVTVNKAAQPVPPPSPPPVAVQPAPASATPPLPPPSAVVEPAPTSAPTPPATAETPAQPLATLAPVQPTPAPAPAAPARPAVEPAPAQIAAEAEPPALAAPPVPQPDSVPLTTVASTPEPAPSAGALYRKWWFWSAVAVVAGVTVGAVALFSRGGEKPCHGIDPCWELP